MRRSRWFLALGFGFSVAALAQQTPNAAPAFRAEGLYDYSGFDQVSLFSGGLSAQIPITTFGGELQVQILLSYSSSAWEARPTTCPPDFQICGASMKPKPTDRVGLGFKVTLGELYQPAFGSNLAINRWLWVSPDGSEHALYPTLHRDDPQDAGDPNPSTGMFERFMYSRDSSYARVYCLNASYSDCTVETADGLRRFFHNIGTAQLPNYRIEWISDRFDNTVTIEYLFSPTRWVIRDRYSVASPERKIVLTFEAPPTGWEAQPLLLQTIEAPCFLVEGEGACRGAAGTVATWTFSYVEKPTYPPSVYTQSPEQRNVWYLDNLELPDGSKYSFPDYATLFNGGLETAVLPTFGRLEWAWDTLLLPAVRSDPTCPSELPPSAEYWSSTFAVTQRRQFDIGGGALGVWNYTRETDVPEPLVGEILTVTVEGPLHDLTQYFFGIWAANFCYVPQHQSAQWEYGLPYSRAEEDPLSSTPRRYLSARHYDCANAPNPVLGDCTLKRSTFQAWEIDDGDSVGGWSNGEIHDRNRRMRSERTIFHETSGDKYKLVQMGDFDGLGHYRTTTRTDDVAGHDRTSFTFFNSLRGTYTGLPGQVYDPIDSGENWILGTFTEQSTTETSIVNDPSGTSTQVAKEEFCFDGPTGFLTRHRRLSANGGTPRAGNDVLLVRTADPDGNLIREKWFGGDGAAYALDTSQPVCDSAVPATSRYWMEHTYEYGVRKSSQWKDSGGSATGDLAFLTLNRTIDDCTGLIRSVSDVSGLETRFVYDSSGGLAEVRTPSAASPPSAPPAWEVYSYATASVGSGAVVQHQSFPNGDVSGTPLRDERWIYEGLGRIRKERRLAKDGLLDDRFSHYDAAGHRDYLSEWGRGDSAANFRLEWREFDPFGRPGRISRFSNNVFLRDEALMTYVGESKVTRTQWIATSAPGGVPTEVSVQRVESFDEHGRLAKVEELSDSTSVATSYEYDVGNRLRRSGTPISSGGEQKRWWFFDQRGFLTSEVVPEKGVAGNGTVTYRDYDPLGNSWNRIDGIEVGSIFDRAGRLTEVDEIIPRPPSTTIIRPLKQFGFGTGNNATPDGMDYALGKLVSATGFNWVVVGGTSGFDVRFEEGLQYLGTGGARSESKVVLKLAGYALDPPANWVPPPTSTLPSYERYFHKEAFNALGERFSLTYPECIEQTYQCPTAQPHRTVATSYSNGYLATVSDASTNWVSSATYHRSGLWNTMGRGNGVVETQLQDALGIARPRSIEAKFGTASLWKSGTHEYDRSGNLTRLVATDEGGNDLFLYDKVSRLKEATIQIPVDLGPLVFADGFESGTSQRWLEAWPPTGWSAGLKTQNFTFDRFGNLTQILTTGQTAENFVTSGSTNRMDASIAAYDNRGNLTSFDGATSSFDAINRQWKRLNPDGSADYYLYTADDERILTFSPGTPTPWHWMLRDFAGKVLRKYELVVTDPPEDSYVAAVQDYVHAGERVLGTEDPRVPGASRMFATVDHLGTPRLWSDADGNPLRKLKYYPFGKEATPSDQWNVALQFTGHERDRNDLATATDDGDYLHARFGALPSGRMVSVDMGPTRLKSPQSWNRYAYVLGNPMILKDPSGDSVSVADLDDAQQQELIASLSQATGNKFGVDPKGNLVVLEYGEGGSPTAATLLGEMISSEKSYSVKFESAATFGRQIGNSEIQLDPSDFKSLEYGKVPRQTFSLATTFFHEAAHTFGLDDPKRPVQSKELGQPEELVNTIRRELGLPERVGGYAPEDFGARLGFAFSRTGSSKIADREYVYFPKNRQ